MDHKLIISKLKDKIKPIIFIGTPLNIINILHKKYLNISISSYVQNIIIFDYDLMISYDYKKEMKRILEMIPKISKKIIITGDTSKRILNYINKNELKNLIKFDFNDKRKSNVLEEKNHFYLKYKNNEKYLALFLLLKFKVVKEKAIIITNSIKSAYELKIFLDKICLKGVVLIDKMPLNSKFKIINEFRNGIFDYLVTDEEGIKCMFEKVTEMKVEKLDRNGNVDVMEESDGKNRIIEDLYNDYKEISNDKKLFMIHFNVSESKESYLLRCKNSINGSVLSFVETDEYESFCEIKKECQSIKFYEIELNIEDFNGLKERIKYYLSGITKNAIKIERSNDIKSELLKSMKLQEYFKDNPKELKILKNDSKKKKIVQLNIPSYMLPNELIIRIVNNIQLKNDIDSNIKNISIPKAKLLNYVKKRIPYVSEKKIRKKLFKRKYKKIYKKKKK